MSPPAPARYLLDEHLRGLLWDAIQDHNATRSSEAIDAVCVGDPADLPLGTDDPSILRWAEREGRILISSDRKTMIGFFHAHLQTNRHSPGLFVLRKQFAIPDVLEFLVLAAHAAEPWEWRDQIRYCP